jgi:hypothetical protein
MSRKKAVLAVILILFTIIGIDRAMIGQDKPAKSNQSQPTVQLPAIAPTIPSDYMYTLGQQTNQLANISTRLDRIDDRIGDIRSDITRIDTILWVSGAAIGLIFAPILVHWLIARISGQGKARAV